MDQDRENRLRDAAARAKAAEDRGDHWAANEAWREYELIQDGGRDPGELLAEAIALSAQAISLAESAR